MNLKILLALSIFCLLSASGLFAQAQSRVELSVDKTVLSLPCRYHLPAKYRSCPNGMTVNVRARVKGNQLKNLRYEYVVSYGTIIGTGSKVTWDMTKEQAGTYEIKAKVFDGSSEIGNSVTKVVRVKECVDCGGDCFCSFLSLMGNVAEIKPGGIMRFTAVFPQETGYRWSVKGGKILKGQNTNSVLVKASSAKNVSTLTVLVSILASIDPRCILCPSKQSATVAIRITPTPSPEL